MGTQDVKAGLSVEQRQTFMKALLQDVRAMEQMLEQGCFSDPVQRIGAEQELVIVDGDWQPAPLAMGLLEDLDDPRVTTEIAKFNLEANLPPLEFTGDCLARMEAELNDVIAVIRRACHARGAEVILTGILPTLVKGHLSRENIADRPRYFELDKALLDLRGGAYELKIKGTDEVSIETDSVILEGLNTSFQIHYQVQPETFAAHYNLAQAIAAPVLAAAVNSPVLFGKRLWRETRIAIFQQAVDTRLAVPDGRDILARVRFGEDWVNHSVLELFKNDIARFRVILGREVDEDPFAAIESGRPPQLQALQLHNSTVYRWNRACYGAQGPHLRIENRILPAGPTVVDEVANAAFWFGLMRGGLDAWGDPKLCLDFDEVRANFGTAAREGLHAEFNWMNNRYLSARDLIVEEMLPVARAGLDAAGVDAADRDRLLGIIADRVESRHTGAQWLLHSVASMRGAGTRAERLASLTAGIAARQHPDHGTVEPVHRWAPAGIEEGGGWTKGFQRVEQYMATDLFTVHEDDTLDLVVTLMDWEHIRHVPVEDAAHRLIGLVSYRPLLNHLAKCMTRGDGDAVLSIPVRAIMKENPLTVAPKTSTVEAIALMREHQVSCLPVVDDGRLVGLITEHDFMAIASQLLESHLRSDQPGAGAEA